MNDELRGLLQDYTAAWMTQSLLQWDKETMMPENGLPGRKAQLSYLDRAAQDILVSDDFDDALTEFEEDAGTEDHDAMVRELRRIQRRSAAVPSELTEAMSEAQTEAVGAWRRARDNDEFEGFADALQDVVDLKREYAEHVNAEEDPYTVLFREFEPYVEMSTVENVFDQLTKELPRRLEKVREADVDIPSPFKGTFDTKTQERVCKAVMSDFGLKSEESRLNLSTHPFTTGSAFEARITTRIDESDLTEALSCTVHEAGHALYLVGLDEENWWNPLGWHRDATIHESQARYWENHVGRRKAFMAYLLPVLNRHFRGEFDGFSVEDAYKAVNHVKEDNCVRTEADELTYHLHVAIRFELGRDLINGDLAVKDLPKAWDEKMEDYLGVTPPSLAKGCLQDMHWANGMFGYFPTYTLGSMVAAQLDEAVADEVDVEERIRQEDFDDLLDWQRRHIHCEGQRQKTEDLVWRTTGRHIGVDAYLDHVDSVLSDVYDIMV